VSHHRNIAVLSHHQPIGSRTGTFVAPEVADLLVQRMAAEKISAKVIRMMSPDSPFLPAVRAALLQTKYIPFHLPASELPGVLFRGPKNPVPHFCSTMGPNCTWDWSVAKTA
jgi:hypothetical protein